MRASTLWCVLLRHGETEAAIVYSCYMRVLVNYSLAVVGGYEGLSLIPRLRLLVLGQRGVCRHIVLTFLFQLRNLAGGVGMHYRTNAQ